MKRWLMNIWYAQRYERLLIEQHSVLTELTKASLEMAEQICKLRGGSGQVELEIMRIRKEVDSL